MEGERGCGTCQGLLVFNAFLQGRMWHCHPDPMPLCSPCELTMACIPVQQSSGAKQRRQPAPALPAHDLYGSRLVHQRYERVESCPKTDWLNKEFGIVGNIVFHVAGSHIEPGDE